MNYEEKIISLINGVMPRSPLRKSMPGEADAEVILLGDKEYLFTTDDFSAEDLLLEDDPSGLGWNLACGAISDIVAAGGRPLVYAHSMVIPKNWDEPYIRKFSQGVSRVLKTYSCSFIGGDLGFGDTWRYTASVLGEPVGRSVNRKGCQAGDAIFITGKIGAGNLDAVLSLFPGSEGTAQLLQRAKNRFRSLEKLPEIVSTYASCAIDTSDGVFAAVQTLANLNGTGFHINQLPFLAKGVRVAKLLQLPSILLFLGECGEYEILFTVNQRKTAVLKACLKDCQITAYELGELTDNPRQRTVTYRNSQLDCVDYNLRARDFPSVTVYLQAMTDWLATRGIRR